MKIGMVGSGNIGGTLGRLWAAAGHEVVFSYSTDPARLAALATSVGPMGSSGTPADAATADVVVLSVPWPRVEDALRAAGAAVGSLDGRVLVDTTNPYLSPGGPLAADLAQGTAAARVAELVPGARLVKAFNTLYYVTLGEQARRPGERLGVPVSGDDPAARATVASLVADAGYDAVELGGLDQVWRQEPSGPLYSRELTADQIRASLRAGRDLADDRSPGGAR